jgi:hypothetical protein
VPAQEQLSEYFAGLSDAELIARVRSGTLTDEAARVADRELSARGIAADHGSALPTITREHTSGTNDVIRGAMRFFLTRVLPFPLRAVMGSEPLWAVLVFGGILFVFVYKMGTLGLAHLILSSPRSPHLLPFAYALLTTSALAAIWFGIALWYTAGRIKSGGWKLLTRVLAVLMALNFTLGSIAAARQIRVLFPPALDGASLMDTAPPR